MSFPVSLNTLSKETLFKKGDFNKITALYNEMLSLNIAKDCAPLIDTGLLAFLIYKSAKDPIYLYKLSIERDEKNQRFIYEVIDATSKQIAQGKDLDMVLKKFKYHMGKTHHIQHWKKSKRATERNG